MLVTIAIPTWKKRNEVEDLIKEVKASLTNKYEYEIIASCIEQSAAKNRNWCIKNAKGEIIIQIDDDIKIYEKGWADSLVDELIKNKNNVSMLAPLLVDAKGKHVPQLGDGGWYKLKDDDSLKVAIHTPKTDLNVVCSACICFFKSNEVYFDEKYKHAAVEDLDFSMEMAKAHPDKKICITDKSKIVHLNHGSWRRGGTLRENQQYFIKKWNINIWN